MVDENENAIKLLISQQYKMSFFKGRKIVRDSSTGKVSISKSL